MMLTRWIFLRSASAKYRLPLYWMSLTRTC
jgi:hypothetical protein